MRTKNFCLAMGFVAVMLFWCFPSTAVAGYGRIIIVRPVRPVIIVQPRVIIRPIFVLRPRYIVYPPVVLPPYYGYGGNNPVMLNNSNNNVINVNNGTAPLPPLPPVASGGAVAYGVSAGTEQAIIAWNGKTDEKGEQTLILTTNEVSTGVDMAVLSVLPLPGKPISIEQANAKAFVQSKILHDKKLREVGVMSPGGATAFGAIMTQKIGSHNIFVWEIEGDFDIDAFKDNVNAYIAETYGTENGNANAVAEISDEALQIIKGYFDRGFRYFAFDLTEVKKEASTKEAIAYRFQSKEAYYPLAIGGVGGTGHGLIDLVVMTPGNINLLGAFEQGKEEAEVFVKGGRAVDFTINEVKDLDPSLSGVFDGSGLNSVRVRNFLIGAREKGVFKNDFRAIPAQ